MDTHSEEYLLVVKTTFRLSSTHLLPSGFQSLLLFFYEIFGVAELRYELPSPPAPLPWGTLTLIPSPLFEG
jgi:hypothetical protein